MLLVPGLDLAAAKQLACKVFRLDCATCMVGKVLWSTCNTSYIAHSAARYVKKVIFECLIITGHQYKTILAETAYSVTLVM